MSVKFEFPSQASTLLGPLPWGQVTVVHAESDGARTTLFGAKGSPMLEKMSVYRAELEIPMTLRVCKSIIDKSLGRIIGVLVLCQGAAIV